jgi:L-2-hydroxyglutarate oxidase LhgO
MDFDIVIVGAGVVGLASSVVISQKGMSVLVLERNPSFGWETSSRNSEVIHAGLYYPPGSLKAKLCVEGNRSLHDWCHKYHIHHAKIGKFIIATNESEEAELEAIRQNATNNGAEVEYVSLDYFKTIEPGIRATTAMWSPNTGIIDSHKLMESFISIASENDCTFAYKHELFGIEKIIDGYKLQIYDPDHNPCEITCRYLINSAGLNSDTVATLAGIDVSASNYNLKYCKGNYFRISNSRKYNINHLIYPVPHKNLNGLGVHLTIELGGGLKLGPDTQYLTDRNQDYSVSEALLQPFFNSASKYIIDLSLDDIEPDQSGIRPKLQGENETFRDFIIKEESDKGLPGLINLIGIESPGLTSCLEIAKIVAGLLS